MEMAQHDMQPVAEVTLVDLTLELLLLLQPEQPQREEPVGAAPQILVTAGRQARQRHPCSGWLRHVARQRGQRAFCSPVLPVLRVPHQQLQQPDARHPMFACRALAPEDVQWRGPQRVIPGQTRGEGEFLVVVLRTY